MPQIMEKRVSADSWEEKLEVYEAFGWELVDVIKHTDVETEDWVEVSYDKYKENFTARKYQKEYRKKCIILKLIRYPEKYKYFLLVYLLQFLHAIFLIASIILAVLAFLPAGLALVIYLTYQTPPEEVLYWLSGIIGVVALLLWGLKCLMLTISRALFKKKEQY